MRSQWSRLGTIVAVAVMVGACASEPSSGVQSSVAAGLQPRLSSNEAVAITRSYLDQQTRQLAAPELHVASHVTNAWAVRAREAWQLDGCIPKTAGGDIVWVTRGQGDYLNLAERAWSHTLSVVDQAKPDETRLRCFSPGTAGTLVIDDATGSILGVYPESSGYPHPAPGSQ